MMQNATLVKDPVCGMDIEAGKAAAMSAHKGENYHFCSSKCKEKFEQNPEQYLGKSAGTGKSGKGCCS